MSRGLTLRDPQVRNAPLLIWRVPMTDQSQSTQSQADQPRADQTQPNAALTTTATQAVVSEAPTEQQSRYFHVAYQRLRPRFAAFPSSSVLRVSLDTTLIVQTVLGVMPELEQLKEEIAWELPRVDLGLINELREMAFAVIHLESLSRGAKGFVSEDSSDPVQQVRHYRSMLLADVQPLVARGLLEPEASTLSRGNSPRNLAFDTLQLANYLDRNWDQIQGRSLTTREEIDASRDAVRELLTYLGVKDQGGESEEEVQSNRLKGITLLVKLYEELRWAVRYIRRNTSDADLVMPSLYSLRKSPRRGAPEVDDPSTDLPPSGDAESDDVVDTERLEELMASVTHRATSTDTANAEQNGDTNA